MTTIVLCGDPPDVGPHSPESATAYGPFPDADAAAAWVTERHEWDHPGDGTSGPWCADGWDIHAHYIVDLSAPTP